MNIHITDNSLFQALKSASLVSCQFGSHLYQTNDELSDKDVHYIYATSVNEMNSFLKSHHHLQYHENGVDHIFVNLHVFLNNLIKGDSTVLFEIVHSGSLINTTLEFLYDMRNTFNNYAIIRSYMGFAKRDILHYHTKETHRDQLKALCHIWRGYFFAKSIMKGNFKLIDEEFLKTVVNIKSLNNLDYIKKKEFLDVGKDSVSEFREMLNYKFNNNLLDIPKYMTIENQILLDKNINNLMKNDIWKRKQSYLNNFDMSIFYDAFENNINY